jgi:hypothetical protein
MLYQGRTLATNAAPFQVEGLLSALNQLRSRAAGSTASNFPAIISQLSDLRSTYGAASRAISRKLGFAGGGQVEREKSSLLARAGGQYGSLLQGAQAEGFSGLMNTQGAVQPFLSGSARPPVTSTAQRTNPFAANAAGILAGQALPGQISTIYGAAKNAFTSDPYAETKTGAGLSQMYYPDNTDPYNPGTSYILP